MKLTGLSYILFSLLLSISCNPKKEKELQDYSLERLTRVSIDTLEINARIDSIWSKDTQTFISISVEAINRSDQVIRNLRLFCPREYCHIVSNSSFEIIKGICYANGPEIQLFHPNEPVIEKFLVRKLNNRSHDFKVGLEIVNVPYFVSISKAYELLSKNLLNKKSYLSNTLSTQGFNEK